jgi:hypothetical protein
MKIGISISAYTNSPASLELTKKCILNIKQNTDYFVICTNHLPGDSELANMCDLYLYEKNNVLTTHTFYNHSWLITDAFRMDIKLQKSKNDVYHGPAVHQNIYNGVSLGKMAGLDYVICMNFDVILAPSEFKKINDIVNTLIEENKSAFFLKSLEQEGYHLKTVFFITRPEYYLTNIDQIASEADYNELLKKSNAPSNGLENMYYHIFENTLHQSIVIEQNELEFFSEGSNFTNSQAEYYAVLPILNRGNHSNTAAVVCTFKNETDNRVLNYEVYEDDTKILEGTRKVETSGWFIDTFPMNDTAVYKTIINMSGNGITKTKVLEYNGYQDILDSGGVDYF